MTLPTATPLTTDVTTSSADTPSAQRRDLRVAGLGALLAFGAWLLQPILVLVLLGDAERSTYADLEDTAWTSGYELVTFALVGAGLLLLVDAVRRLCAAAGDTSPAMRVGHQLGTASALAWFALGAVTAAPFSSAATDLGDLAAADQTATITAFGVTQMAVLLFAVVCGAGWSVMLATSSRRLRVVGTPTAMVAGLAAVSAVVPFFVPFSPPWGTLTFFVLTLVLGVGFLLRARRA